MHSPRLGASFVIYIYNIQFSNLILGNDITTDIDFISTWVWYNLIEMYEMGSWPPPPLCNRCPFVSHV